MVLGRSELGRRAGTTKTKKPGLEDVLAPAAALVVLVSEAGSDIGGRIMATIAVPAVPGAIPDATRAGRIDDPRIG